MNNVTATVGKIEAAKTAPKAQAPAKPEAGKAKAPTGKSKPEAAKTVPKAQTKAKAPAKGKSTPKAQAPAKGKPSAAKTEPAKGKPEAGKSAPKAQAKAPTGKSKPEAGKSAPKAKASAPGKTNVPAKVELPAGALALDTQAKHINAALEKAQFHQGKANDMRLTAACYLADAKKRIEGGELGKVKFLAWCADNIKRSRADIFKLVKIGNSPDAQKALEDLRGKAAESMKKTRAKRKAAPAAQTPAPATTAPAEPTFEPGKMPWTETETAEPTKPAAPVELDGNEPAPQPAQDPAQTPAAPVEEPRGEDRNRLFEAAKAAFNAITHDGDRRAFVRWAQLALANGNGQGKGDDLTPPNFLNRKKS